MAANDVPLQYDDGTRHQQLDLFSYSSSTLSLKAGKHLALSSTSNFGAYGTAPIAQPSGAEQAALGGTLTGTTDNTLADLASTWDASAAAAANKNFKEVQELINALRTALVSLGLIKGSA